MIEYGKLLEKNIIVNCKDSASVRFKNKEVLEEKILSNFSDAEINYPTVLKDGKVSFVYSTYIKNIKERRAHPNIVVNFDDLNLEGFNQFKAKMHIKSQGFINFYIHFSIVNNGKEYTHTQSVYPNCDEEIVWEINNIKLDKVSKFIMLVFVMGTPPEADENVEIILDSLVCNKVKPEYEEGWDIEDRIAYSHIGYLTDFEKKALVKNETKFEIVDEEGNVLYTGISKKIDRFYEIDFSEFKEEGLFKIKAGNIESEYFEISNNIYTESILKTMNFYKSLRCGELVEGVHSPCHLYSKTVHPVTGQTVPDFGGWHDAGDLSQFEICTAEMTSSLCDLALSVKDKEIKERLVEEIYVGANWLLRTRFGDGYRANTVLYRTWHSNVLNNEDTSVSNNVAEEGPFENFISSEGLSKTAKVVSDETFKYWCLKAAKEDFEFGVREYDNGIYTKRWGKSMDSQTIGALLSSACSLYDLTNDEKYLKICEKYVEKVLATQETNTNLDLYGFFYEDKEHNYVLTYEHRGHEQSPVCGLVSFYEYSQDKDYISSETKNKVYKAIKMYSDYVKKSCEMMNNEYNLLPSNVYMVDKINIEHFTTYGYEDSKALEILKEQVTTGKKLNNGLYLRNFPIAVSRRGYHATLLSKVKGVSSIANLFNDKELKQIAINQIQWILGYNPFATSTMYGLGHNYHPLYVAFSKQMVGALPVGFRTLGSNDAPHWPIMNNAVYKEIWGHTSGKFLWVIADLLK